MRALVKYEMGPGHVEVRDVPEPEVGPGLVKIKVVRASLCGSDVSQYRAAIPMRLKTPVIMGHEFSGIVEEVGEGVTRFKPGQKVAAENGYHVCGVCEFCREGYYNLCIERKVLGFWQDGSFAEKVLIPENNVVAVPDSLGFDEATVLEPLACICHACYDLITIKASDVVLVSGPGPMAQLAAQVSKSFGATVIVTGLSRDTDRLAKAKELGADYAVNIEKEDIRALVDNITNGYGVDVIIECTSAVPAINQCLDLIKKRGYYVQFGLCGKGLPINMEAIMFKEIKLTGAMGARNYNWRKAVTLLEQRKVNTQALVSEPYSLYDWEKMVEAFDAKEGFKMILDPSLPGPVQ